MAQVTYEMIKPIIVKEEIGENGMINLEFKCDGMEQPLPTVAVVVPGQDEIMQNVAKQAAKTAAINTAVSGAASLLGGALGSAASSLGGKVAGAAAGNPADMLKTEMTDEKKQKAIVQAFMNMQQFFAYDEAAKKWSYKQPTA